MSCTIINEDGSVTVRAYSNEPQVPVPTVESACGRADILLDTAAQTTSPAQTSQPTSGE